MFLINFELYKKLFKYFIASAVLFWLYVHSLQYFNIILPLIFWNIWDTIVVISFSIIGPGLILYILHYIKHHSAKYTEAKLFGKYHLHEGFFGLIITIFAMPIYLLRVYLMQFEIFWNQLGFILAIINIFLYLFLFIGSFLIFRDWNDVISLKLIEKKETNKFNDNSNITSVFNNLSKEDLHFFEFPSRILYPVGLYITSFSISAIVYGGGFLPTELFHLSHEAVILSGFILGFIAGALLGKDWLRLFKRFYPSLYNEINEVIKKLKS
ncbi:MAG: hypothetical protein ACTSR8_02290 [Promethearchaeota archaeon]